MSYVTISLVGCSGESYAINATRDTTFDRIVIGNETQALNGAKYFVKFYEYRVMNIPVDITCYTHTTQINSWWMAGLSLSVIVSDTNIGGAWKMVNQSAPFDELHGVYKRGRLELEAIGNG